VKEGVVALIYRHRA